MQVVATAGHVDHGKSTLIRALTGIDTDRWAEEKRRGLTIDLGFAWTALPSGREVSFVDVPGHERFLGNTLAGLGPVRIVCFVVAADEGWQAQSDDHRDAVAALGIEHGLVALTRADRADDERIGTVTAQVRSQLAGTGLADAPIVPVSAWTGEGIENLRAALDGLLASAPTPRTEDRLRLWVDRAFSISGAGTVVTGTLGAGTLRADDRLRLLGAEGDRDVQVRGLQSREQGVGSIEPASRAAVNLRGIEVEAISRGDALVAPGQWHSAAVIDVRRATGVACAGLPEELVVHVGTAAVPARVRPFDADHARLTLDRELPLQVGEYLVLRGSGERAVLGGVLVLDVDPPALDRRGAGTRRAAALAEMSEGGDVSIEVRRRGAVRADHVRRLGVAMPEPLPADVRGIGPWLVHTERLAVWARALRTAVEHVHRDQPLAPGLTRGAAASALDLPDPELLAAVAREAGLALDAGHVRDASVRAGLGAAEVSVAELERRLRAAPFRAPEADDLSALRLGPRELAAAERQGRLLRLPDGVILLPTAPALAMRELATLPQPFTTSQARQAWGTTRRVAIPLLEHLDARGWTRRLDGTRREIAR